MLFQLLAEILVIVIIADVLCRIIVRQGLLKAIKSLFGESVTIAVKEATEKPPPEISDAQRAVTQLEIELRAASEELRLAEERGELEEEIEEKQRALRSVRSKLG